MTSSGTALTAAATSDALAIASLAPSDWNRGPTFSVTAFNCSWVLLIELRVSARIVPFAARAASISCSRTEEGSSRPRTPWAASNDSRNEPIETPASSNPAISSLMLLVTPPRVRASTPPRVSTSTDT